MQGRAEGRVPWGRGPGGSRPRLGKVAQCYGRCRVGRTGVGPPELSTPTPATSDVATVFACLPCKNVLFTGHCSQEGGGDCRTSGGSSEAVVSG